jgi:ERCC4-type nuclease
MNAASVEGSLAYLATTFDRLRIIHRPDRPSASLFLKSLVRREQTEGRHYPVLKEWKRGQNLDQAKLAMIGQLPGIGGRLAAQVLREKKTVEAATQMREIDWRKYTSKPRARDIEKVLREPVA